MKLVLAADHRGFKLKEVVKKFLAGRGHEVEDVGAFEYNQEDDYVDFARAAIEKILKDPEKRGVLICGSGHGENMVADKYKGIRAALAFNRQVAVQSREHEDSNILVLPSDWLDEAAAQDIIIDWLETKFMGEDRHVRRLKKIEEIEGKNFK